MILAGALLLAILALAGLCLLALLARHFYLQRKRIVKLTDLGALRTITGDLELERELYHRFNAEFEPNRQTKESPRA